MSQKKKISDLPFGSEFSPSQIDLPDVLETVATCEGDIALIESTIRANYFSNHGSKNPIKAKKNQKILAMNCRLGLQSYGIIDENGMLTSLGLSLRDQAKNGIDFYKTFARHILANLNGMRVVQCVLDMVAAGEKITLETLEKALRLRGMAIARISRHLSSMRLWLRKSGVAGNSWQDIDQIKLKEIMGVNPEDIGNLSGLSPAQRAFLRAFANTGKMQAQGADGVRDLAESLYGITLPKKNFSSQVIKPLEDAGWLVVTKTTGGRGAKNALIAPTAKVDKNLIEPILQQMENQVDIRLLELLRKPLGGILSDMESTDAYISGLALEALAFKLMQLLDMTYVDTRLKSGQTGGAEVDLIFESARLVFSRWQIQCKNYKKSGAAVRVDDVAKEVGLTHTLKSNAIIVVTTGSISKEARKYANHVMRDSNLAIVLLDGKDIGRINDDPSRIVDIFRREAEHAMQLKKITNSGGQHG